MSDILVYIGSSECHDGQRLRESLVDRGIKVLNFATIQQFRDAFPNAEIKWMLSSINAMQTASAVAQVTRKNTASKIECLTQRELQLLGLVAQGKSSKRISQELNISVRTVANHRAHIRAKLKADSVAELVRMYIEWRHEAGHNHTS